MMTVVNPPRSLPAVGYLVEEDEVGASSVVRSVVELADASAAHFTRASGERDAQEEYCRRGPISERDHGTRVLQRPLQPPTPSSGTTQEDPRQRQSARKTRSSVCKTLARAFQ